MSAVMLTAAALSSIAPAAAQSGHFMLRMPGQAHVAPYYFGPRPFVAERRESREELGADILGFACSSRATDAMAMVFDRLDRRLDLTAEQQPLFEDLRTSALVAQTSVADSCAAFPVEPENLLERTKFRQARLTAQLAAIDDVLPKLDAFYASLTEAQQKAIEPSPSRAITLFRDRPERPERLERPERPSR
jgi:hypothetical protein